MMEALFWLFDLLADIKIKISPFRICVVKTKRTRRDGVFEFQFKTKTHVIENLEFLGMFVKNLSVLLFARSYDLT